MATTTMRGRLLLKCARFGSTADVYSISGGCGLMRFMSSNARATTGVGKAHVVGNRSHDLRAAPAPLASFFSASAPVAHSMPSTSCNHGVLAAAAANGGASVWGQGNGGEGSVGSPETRWLGVLALAGLAAAAALWKGNTVFASSAGNDERSFIMIKPDGVARGLVSAIIGRFEARGYKLIGLKMITPSIELAEKHYDEHRGKPFFRKLTSFLSSGPVVAMVFEGKGVVQTGRQMIGSTNPASSNPGTIRGDYGIDLGRNIVHGSDSHESAFLEISLWFAPGELNEYEKPEKAWLYE